MELLAEKGWLGSETFNFPGMTPALQNFLRHAADREAASEDYKSFREKHVELRGLIEEGLLDQYNRCQKAWMCRDATQTGDPKVFKSPSGHHEVHVTSHSTGKGTWNYSKAKVYRGGELISEVCRNYGAFPHLFVEDHPNGHAYLICGEDYQGQTVIELDTGRRRDFLPKEAKDGFGFCWASYKFHTATQVLLVDGCYWACPYEFKFYDFSDPMEKGWTLLETECGIDADQKPPVLGDDGIITTFETRWEHPEDEDNEDFDEDTAPRVDAVIRKFRRENGKLTLVSEWVSDAEKEQRRKNEEEKRAYNAWLANFRSSDPLYLAFKRFLKDPVLSPEDHCGIGVTHEGWCPEFKKLERRYTTRIVTKKPYTIDLGWGVETGPVKLTIYKSGTLIEDKFFDHSVEGMTKAFDLAKTLAGAS